MYRLTYFPPAIGHCVVADTPPTICSIAGYWYFISTATAVSHFGATLWPRL